MNEKTQQLLPATEALVLRAVGKDAEAFAELIRRYERVALSVAFSVTGNADAAGDVVQESFLRAWQRIAELKEPAHFATWLCGIARNLAIDIHRKRRRVKNCSAPDAVETLAVADERWNAGPSDDLDRRERHAEVAAALQSLDEVTRPAVILRYYDGLSSKEIGKVLHMSPASVDMRLSRARQQLKKLLEPLHYAANV